MPKKPIKKKPVKKPTAQHMHKMPGGHMMKGAKHPKSMM